MRSYRVFNDVTNVRVEWKIAGRRLGPFTQVALISHMALSVVLLNVAGLIPAGVVFVVGALSILVYAKTVSDLDPTGALSERTQLVLLRRCLRNRYRANFELPGL